MIVAAAALILIVSLVFLMVIESDFGWIEYKCHGLSILHLGFLDKTMDMFAAIFAATASAAVVGYWFSSASYKNILLDE